MTLLSSIGLGPKLLTGLSLNGQVGISFNGLPDDDEYVLQYVAGIEVVEFRIPSERNRKTPSSRLPRCRRR